ncbi:MAG: DUF3471 domain-containing protein, partial [Bergeyella zoohelcum]|nr:DUF3471 domain-containing protein [Bergeyella zoohelcum]
VFGRDYKIPSFKTIEVTAEELTPYLGTYASERIPLKITITSKGNKLFAQATDQPEFEMQATDKHTFQFTPAGIEIVFNPDKNEMLLKQSGAKIPFKKEK